MWGRFSHSNTGRGRSRGGRRRSGRGTSDSDNNNSGLPDPAQRSRPISGKELIAALDTQTGPRSTSRSRTRDASATDSPDQLAAASVRAGTATIYVKNLDFKVTDDVLWSFFETQIGKVKSAEVDQNTRCTAEIYGVVDFWKAVDAEEAVKRFDGVSCLISRARNAKLEVWRDLDPNYSPQEVQAQGVEHKTAAVDQGQSSSAPPARPTSRPSGVGKEPLYASRLASSAQSSTPGISITDSKSKPTNENEAPKCRQGSYAEIASRAAAIPMAQPLPPAPEPPLVANGIYLLNIRRTIEHDEIRQLFRPAGNLTDIKINPVMTGGHRWALVHFETAERARWAMKTFNGECAILCGGANLRMEWSVGHPTAILWIENIDATWSDTEVARRLSQTVSPIQFEPNPVRIIRGNSNSPACSTTIKFANAATAEQVVKYIRSNGLDGDRMVKVSHVTEDQDPTPAPPKGRVRLDNVRTNWNAYNVFRRATSVITDKMTGCIINAVKVGVHAPGRMTGSYMLTLDSQETATQIVPRLDKQTLGGTERIRAVILPPI